MGIRRRIEILALLSAVAVSGQQLYGQQTVQYTHYIDNAFGLNPAVAGSKKCINIQTGYRLQWLGFAGAPRSMYASIHGAIGMKKTYKRGWHGLGLYIEKDDAGPYSSKGVYPAYAYHLKIARRFALGFGIFVGIRQAVFKGNEVYGSGPDPLLGYPSSTLMVPEISPGIWLHSKRTFAGLSAKQVYNTRMSGIGGAIGSPSKSNMHYYFHFYRIIEDPDYYYTYIPSIHIKYTPLYPPGVDLGFMWIVKSKWGLGVTYRYQDAVAATAEYKFLKMYKISYSFDFTTSKIRMASSNTHEIVFSITPCKDGDRDEPNHTCPAYN